MSESNTPESNEFAQQPPQVNAQQTPPTKVKIFMDDVVFCSQTVVSERAAHQVVKSLPMNAHSSKCKLVANVEFMGVKLDQLNL